MQNELASLHEQLSDTEQNLRLIRERKAAYVLAEDVPLQLVKNERALEQQIARLRERIAAMRSTREKPGPGNGQPHAAAPRKRWTIFLAHSGQEHDRIFATWLYHKLRSADLTVWYDESEILVGDSIPARVSEGLVESEFLAVVLSAQAVAAGWVQHELEPRLLQQIYGREVIVLPLLVGHVDFADIPPLLRGKRSIQFPPQGSDEKFRELLADIDQHLRRRGLLQAARINGVPPGSFVAHNPFGLRGGIEPARFVVPVRLVREVTEDIAKRQSVSIVGARMLGKTSLMKFLASERASSYYKDEWEANVTLRFAMLDLQEHAGKPRDALLPLLAQAMSETLDEGARFAGGDHQAALTWIKATAGRTQRGKPRWVLLLDEFDRVAEMHGLDATLFDELRSLPHHYNVSFVIASRRKLIDLPLPQHITTSPFFNLFKEVFLSTWDEATARKLILRPPGPPLHIFSPADTDMLTRLTARHPLLLQIGCYHLFNQRRAGSSNGEQMAQFEHDYMQEAESVYRYYWQHEIRDEEREWLADCWRALSSDNVAMLSTLQRNTRQRRNHTIRVRLAKLGLVLRAIGPIDLPGGVQMFLANGEPLS